MSEGSTSPKRARMDYDDGSREDFNDKYKGKDHDDQGSYSNSRKRRGDTDDDDLKDCDDLKSKNGMDGGPGRREHTLVMRLTNKEQELQECMTQIQEMKQAQTQNLAQLRNMLLDPAINLVFQRMSKEMEEHKEKLKQKQNELNARKFTPDSQTGMRLMGKCRMLLQENGELGKIISSGRTAKLEGEISLHKALAGEMKKNQKELDEFVGELEEDVEGMQGMIFMLQHELKEALEKIAQLQQENEKLRTLQLPSELDPGGVNEKKSFTSLSPPRLVNSSHSSSDHSLAKSSPVSSLMPNTQAPVTSSGELAVSLSSSAVSSSTGDFSPSPQSIKVTPDSGVQTQDEEEETTPYANTDASPAELAGELHLTKNHAAKDSLLEDGVRMSNSGSAFSNDSLVVGERTPLSEEGHDVVSTVHHSVPKSSVQERTSPLTAANGNVLGSTNAESDCLNETRTHQGEVKSQCMLEEAKVNSKLTSNSCDKMGELTTCLPLEQDDMSVNSVKPILTNGSIENVTVGADLV